MKIITRLSSTILWGHQRGKTGFEDPRVSTAGLNPELPRIRRTQEGRTSRNVLGKMFFRLHHGQRGDPPDISRCHPRCFPGCSRHLGKPQRGHKQEAALSADVFKSRCCLERVPVRKFPTSPVPQIVYKYHLIYLVLVLLDSLLQPERVVQLPFLSNCLCSLLPVTPLWVLGFSFQIEPVGPRLYPIARSWLILRSMRIPGLNPTNAGLRPIPELV